MKIMKRASRLFIAVMIFIFCGCNSIKEENITIIDGLVLGKKIDEFNAQYEELGVPGDVFFTNHLYFNEEEVNTEKIKAQYTKKFDSESDSNTHYGLYYPERLEGTDNIISLTVFLGNIGHAMMLGEKNIDLTKETGVYSFSHHIKADLIFKIEEELKERYGEPDIVKKEDISFYAIEGGEIEIWATDKDFPGEILIWHTKNYDVFFFKGIDTNSTYSYNDNSYRISLERCIKPGNPVENSVIAYEFPYVSYCLNKETVEKMNLNKIDL